MLTIYKASAGSGKTFTLARKYLLFLLGTKNNETGRYSLNKVPGKNTRSILAVTFTNKATEEMKKRVVTELSVLAYSPEESKHLEYLQEMFGLGKDIAGISSAAEKELKHLLFNFSNFNISTIDSFFQQILRNFAAEINRPGNFEVELDGNLALTESVDTMFGELSRPEIFKGTKDVRNITRWLMQYIRMQIEEGASFNIFNRDGTVLQDVVGIINSLLNEEYSINSDKINAYLEDDTKLISFLGDIERVRKNLSEKIKERAAALYNNIVSETGEYEMSGFKIKRDFMEFAMENGDYLRHLTDSVLHYPSVDSLFASTYKKKKCPAVSGRVKDGAVRFIEEYINDTVTLTTLKEVRMRIFYLGLLGPLLKVLKARCIDNNTILIQNTNEFIHRIIGDSLSPFIYDKIGSRLNHYLIDEFQDTSRMQWENFRPLILDSLSTLSDNLIIGDEKQCIYRFRNSKPELLGNEVEKQIKCTLHNDDVTEVKGLRLSENTNYRSAPEIIKFNNSIFSALALDKNLKSLCAYMNVIQDIPFKKVGEESHGNVRMHILKAEDDDNSDSLKKKALGLMVSEIAGLLKVYQPGEIAVLTRKNSEAALVMETLLEAMEPGETGIPSLPKFNMVSGQALQVDSAKSVKMIIDILRIVDSPDSLLGNKSGEQVRASKRNSHKADLARLLHHYHIGLSNGENPESSLEKAASPDSPLTDSILDIAMNRQSYELLGTIERVIAHLPVQDRKKDAIFISAFQDSVLTYMEQGGGDIHSFLEWWDKSGSKTPVDSPVGTDSLVISTIHKSKGIEYKCVVIPFVNWNFVENSSAFKRDIRWYDTTPLLAAGFNPEFIPSMIPLEKKSVLGSSLFMKEYEKQNNEQRYDNLNITYVAFTRAVESLSLIAYAPPKSSESVCTYLENALESSQEAVEKQKALEKDGLSDSGKSDLMLNLMEYYDPETGILEIGSLRKKPASYKKIETEEERNSAPQEMPYFKSVERRESLRLGKIESDDYYDPEKIRLKSNYGLSKLGTNAEFEEENIRVIGTFLHQVLSKVYVIRDLRYSLESCAEKALLPEELKERFFNMINDAIGQPEVKRWFDSPLRVLTERPFAVNRNGNVTTMRPDRVVWTKDGEISVIDFKFGKPHRKEHSNQVCSYMRFLKANGEENVRGYIWYINLKKIIEVNDSDFTEDDCLF